MTQKTVTINQAVRLARRSLGKGGEADLLLAHVLGRDAAYLISHGERRLGWWRRRKFQQLIERRRQGWPMAYVLGEKDFYGRTFTVNPHVLIPRPETELMVDMAIQEYQVITPVETQNFASLPLIIDIGTGSGCIAVTLAAEQRAPVIATDISAGALVVARKNARRHGVARRITFLHGSLLEPIIENRRTTNDQRPTILVANLPYLPPDHPADQTPHEPRAALYGGGADGLALITQLIDQAQTLKNLQAMILEVDPRNAVAAERYLDEAMPHGYSALHHDLADHPRVVVWRKTR